MDVMSLNAMSYASDRHGTWSCTLYGGVRLLYSINDEDKRVACLDLLKTHDYGRDSLDSF